MVFMSQERLPDMLFCVAGGSMSLYGLLADIPAEDLETCMKNNYFTSAYAAQSVLKMWVEDDKNVKTSRSVSRPRQIVFINSAAAFLGVPGYVAYACMLLRRQRIITNILTSQSFEVRFTCSS